MAIDQYYGQLEQLCDDTAIIYIPTADIPARAVSAEEKLPEKRRRAGQASMQLAAFAAGCLVGAIAGGMTYEAVTTTQQWHDAQVNQWVNTCAQDLSAQKQPLAAAGLPESCRPVAQRVLAILPRDYVTYSQMGSVSEFVRTASVQPSEREAQHTTAMHDGEIADGVTGIAALIAFSAIFAAEGRRKLEQA